VIAAARLLREGKLVAFPTETVYGLGANALDAEAVRRIFAAKGRPSTSPLIVHVASTGMARSLSVDWPAVADRLAEPERYWPGPLTLVLPKAAAIPDVVTAGLGTVGLRMPAHPIALDLIRAAGVPVAGPSANRFGELSPTTAGHVRASLGDAVDMILDGGPTQVGIESTVVSLVPSPMLLRPGMIAAPEIESITGPLAVASAPVAGPHASPGMHIRHYSPSTALVIEPPATGRGAYLFMTRPLERAHNVKMPNDATSYAIDLYRTLHQVDLEQFDWIAVEMPPEEPEWAAVRDRLTRASA
jgi:L-threonylcarbamoyladenylate synthase